MRAAGGCAVVVALLLVCGSVDALESGCVTHPLRPLRRVVPQSERYHRGDRCARSERRPAAVWVTTHSSHWHARTCRTAPDSGMIQDPGGVALHRAARRRAARRERPPPYVREHVVGQPRSWPVYRVGWGCSAFDARRRMGALLGGNRQIVAAQFYPVEGAVSLPDGALPAHRPVGPPVVEVLRRAGAERAVGLWWRGVRVQD